MNRWQPNALARKLFPQLIDASLTTLPRSTWIPVASEYAPHTVTIVNEAGEAHIVNVSGMTGAELAVMGAAPLLLSLLREAYACTEVPGAAPPGWAQAARFVLSLMPQQEAVPPASPPQPR